MARSGTRIAPARARTAPSEGQLHRAVVKWLEWQEQLGRLTFAHVPNEGRRSRITGARLKALGMRAGFPDLVLFGHFGCGVIELKSKDGKVRPNQIEWAARFDHFEIPHAICRSLEDVIQTIDGWCGTDRRAIA